MKELLLILSLCAALGHCYYYHEASTREFTLAPASSGANFGFSISSLTRSLKLLVGAPLADKLGKVYICDLLDNDANSCTMANRDGITRFTKKKSYDDHYNWYGATVKGQDDFFVACSPLFLSFDFVFVGNSVGTYAQCYSSTYDSKKTEVLAPKRLGTIPKLIRKGNAVLFENAMDSFGWSLDVNVNKSITIGGPAVVSGRVMKIQNDKVQYAIGNTKMIKVLYNFGYSVASGSFFDTKDKVDLIATSSTFGTDGHGKVIFLKDSLKGNEMKPIGNDLNGEQLGSMFGAALCAAQLSGVPQRTDLIVGAPAFATEEGCNIGAVYIYVAKQESPLNMILHRKIIGTMTESYFGSAIVSVGDLNNDKMDEIAIAAPYENEGTGMVYLYRGADIMSKQAEIKPVQKIAPRAKYNAFGYSLAVLNDYDGNGCKELAIGIPANNTVQVLRCRAAITIKLLKLTERLSAPSAGVDKTEELEVCFSAEIPDKPINIKADIEVTIKINHNSARLKDPKDAVIEFNINKKEKIYCKKINLLLAIGDYNQWIYYDLSAKLINNTYDRIYFDSTEVLLNEQSELSLSNTIWVQECGDKLCKPNLKMEPTYSHSDTEPYMLGSSPSINMSVAVQNTGDVAYSACVRVNVTGATASFPQGLCTAILTSQGRLLECKPKQLLRTSKLWHLESIFVNTAELTNEDKSITVSTVLYDDCRILTIAGTTSRVYQLRPETDSVVVHGRTDEGVSDLVNMTRGDIAAQTSFQHIYTISNGGPTNWVNVKINVIAEKTDFLTRSVFIGNDVCIKITETKDEETYACVARKLSTDEGIEVKVSMQVIPDKLDSRIGKEKLTVYSNITMDLDGIPKIASVTSELVLVEAKIPIWIIIAACVIGFIILVIIFFIVRECGFLKRKNRENLKRVRNSVRRQTMMRKSMASPQGQSQDLKLIDEDYLDKASTSQPMKKDRRVEVKG